MSAGAGRTEGVNAQIFRIDLNVNFFSFRKNRNGDRRSVNASTGLSLRHALHAMHAGFMLQFRIDFLAFNQRDGFLHTADSGFGSIENLHLPALAFGIARIHAQDIGSKQGCFIAAGAGANLQNHVLFIVGILRNQQELEVAVSLFELCLQGFNFDLSQLAHVLIFSSCEFARAGQLFVQ